MKKKEMKRVIDQAWAKLERATESSILMDQLVARAMAEEITGERRHRAMCPDSLKSNQYYELSVRMTAKYFILRYTFEGSGSGETTTWLNAATIRPDVMLCNGLHQALKQDDKFEIAFPDHSFMAIDYVAHISKSR